MSKKAFLYKNKQFTNSGILWYVMYGFTEKKTLDVERKNTIQGRGEKMLQKKLGAREKKV